jgi:hypothetical protein
LRSTAGRRKLGKRTTQPASRIQAARAASRSGTPVLVNGCKAIMVNARLTRRGRASRGEPGPAPAAE